VYGRELCSRQSGGHGLRPDQSADLRAGFFCSPGSGFENIILAIFLPDMSRGHPRGMTPVWGRGHASHPASDWLIWHYPENDPFKSWTSRKRRGCGRWHEEDKKKEEMERRGGRMSVEKKE